MLHHVCTFTLPNVTVKCKINKYFTILPANCKGYFPNNMCVRQVVVTSRASLAQCLVTYVVPQPGDRRYGSCHTKRMVLARLRAW